MVRVVTTYLFLQLASEKFLMKFIFLILLQLITVIASPGDKLNRFKRCVRECNYVNCQPQPFNSDWNFLRFDQTLKLLFWSCDQDCDYQCQQIITTERKLKHKPVVQFHGKWPFWRIFGIQEVVSMIFSLGNLVPHIIGATNIYKRLKQSHDYKSNLHYKVILAGSIITCLAWGFSTIFHMRDFLITERLDYYFAGLTVLTGLYMITCRLFGLYEPDKLPQFRAITSLFIFLYSSHIYRLVTDWLYTYNMQANVTIGVIQNIFMTVFCFRLYSHYYTQKSVRNSNLQYTNRIILGSFFNRSDKLFSLYPIFLGVIVIIGMSLEIFDFAPIFYDLIDAHCLWHLVTIIPVCYGWYEWLIWDVEQNVKDSKRD